MTDPTPDAFEELVSTTGLAGLTPSDLYPDDDALHAEDGDGDSLTIVYGERTADDGEAVGVVALSTDGPTGIALVGASGMEQLAEWLTARAARARALEAEQQ